MDTEAEDGVSFGRSVELQIAGVLKNGWAALTHKVSSVPAE
jgi:ppGpp synthetase/RelA/SpoT-type nucleotidyltranferase